MTIKILQSIALMLTITLVLTLAVKKLCEEPEPSYGYYGSNNGHTYRASMTTDCAELTAKDLGNSWMGITSVAEMEPTTADIINALPLYWDDEVVSFKFTGYTFGDDCQITYKDKTATLEELFTAIAKTKKERKLNTCQTTEQKTN